MNLEEQWQKALKATELVRARVLPLSTFETTPLPYVFLGASGLNPADTVVRKGEIAVEKPAIVLPENFPQFEGFEFGGAAGAGHDFVTTFLLLRGIKFPSFKYHNTTETLDVYEGHISKAADYWKDKLSKMEDVRTGLVCGPEDAWQFSLLILVAHQVLRQADGDIRKLMEKYRSEGSA